MEKNQLKLKKKDVQCFARKNQYATLMFCSAAEDYISSRCLILNNLFTGFTLISQSVEKLLKAVIFLETGQKTNSKGLDRHNPYILKEELQEKVDYGLNQFDGLLKRLYGHFQARYFDNKDMIRNMSTKEIREVDDLWIYLLEKAPFPLEVKYRLSFFGFLFDEDALKLGYRYWATHNNKALMGKLKEMEQTYMMVKDFIYS